MTADYEANDNLKEEFAQSADAFSALFNQLYRAVPDYRATTADIVALLDSRIAMLDTNDLETASTFGDSAQDQRSAVGMQILNVQEGDMFGFLREPLQEGLDVINGFDLDSMSSKVSNMAGKGIAVARRNPALVGAATAAAFVVGPLAAILGGAGLIAMKEKANGLRKSFQPESLEDLDAKLRDGIANLKPMIRKLEMAREQIPAFRNNLGTLGNANMQSLVATTLCIAAGREKILRIEEKDLPLAQDAGDTYEVLKLQIYAKTLAGKIAIHEQSRNGSMVDVVNLSNLMMATSDNANTLQSILTGEMAQHISALAANKMAVDTMRITKVVNEFRKSTEKDAERAIKVSEHARIMAASNQADSPERLQATLKNLQLVKTQLENSIKALPTEQEQKKIRSNIENTTAAIVDAQVKRAAGLKQEDPALPAAKKMPGLEAPKWPHA